MKDNSIENERVVITGVGVLSSLGSDFASMAAALSNGNSLTASTAPSLASGPIECFSGCIDDFGDLPADRKRALRKSLKLMNRETQLGVAAAFQAIQDAALDAAGYEPDRVGVCFGAGNVEVRPEDFVAGVQACSQQASDSIHSLWGSTGIPQVDPLWVLRVLPNMPACHIAIGCDFRGPNNTITQAEASTNLAMQEAKYHLIDGDADAMIVGSTGTAIRCAAVQQSESETIGCCSEAAAAFVIERLSTAQARGAKIYAELLGIGSSCAIDATQVPKPADAIRNAMRSSLKQSSAAAQNRIQIAVYNDDRGTATLKQAFASQPARLLNLASWIGQVDAGSSAIGLAAALAHLPAEDPTNNDWAMNLGVTNNGLASCLIVRSLPASRAA